MAVAVTSMAERAAHLYQGYSLVAISNTQLFAGITINNAITTELKVEELTESNDNQVQLKCTLSTYNHAKKRSAPGYRCTVILSNQKELEKLKRTTIYAFFIVLQETQKHLRRLPTDNRNYGVIW